MDQKWRAKALAAVAELEKALRSRTLGEALAHIQNAQGNVLAAIDGIDDARAESAT